jgi:hypothetical protein
MFYYKKFLNINLNFNVMTVQQFWKGLLMILISVVVSALGQVPPDYAYLFVAGVSAILGYVGKNVLVMVVAPATVWTKILSGLLVAVGAGITESAGLFLIDHKIIWLVFFKAVGSICLTYIASSLIAPPATQSKPIKKFAI